MNMGTIFTAFCGAAGQKAAKNTVQTAEMSLHGALAFN